MTPAILPLSSTPVKGARFQAPDLRLALASGMWRQTESSSARVCSAALLVLPKGAFTTITPLELA